MKKIKKIKIKVNGKIKLITDKLSLHKLLVDLRIPISKVAIELNREIVDKKKIRNKKLKKKDIVEIVNFIGGG